MSSYRKYIWAFLITLAIFLGVTLISNYFDNRRIDEIKSIQDSISLNILSSETQFNLLRDAACEDLFSSSLGQELGDLSDRLSYMESVGKGNDPEVVTLKRYYSLLEIKDFLLVNSATKCAQRPATILYFYKTDCPDCGKQGNVLTYLRQSNLNELRVYSFDYGLDVSAVRTLANIYKVKEPLPAIVFKGKAYNGFLSVDDMQTLIPELNATSTATSTKK